MGSSGSSTRAPSLDPYDELPYRSRPIEWSAPERLALCSLIHGGPRAALDGYTVLELGCGDGANLVPLAFYRPYARFVGVDSSRHAIDSAASKLAQLGLANLSFLHADFDAAARQLHGPFDFILLHGVFSWVAPPAREQLLDLCRAQLKPTGLLYLNYNTKPGWNVRGMVRDFLRAQTAAAATLSERTQLAQDVAKQAAAALEGLEHPYAQLMQREYRFVCESHPSYVAHEFLATENHAFWRSEVLGWMSARGLHYVADADFNYDSGRMPETLLADIQRAGWRGIPAEDTADLFSYRQLHSAIFSPEAGRRPLSSAELGQLYVASPMTRLSADEVPRGEATVAAAWFRHPTGYEVEARTSSLAHALERLHAIWPRGTRCNELFSDSPTHHNDLLLLQRHGLIDLRLREPTSAEVDPRLSAFELRWGGYVTDPYHRHGDSLTLTSAGVEG